MSFVDFIGSDCFNIIIDYKNSIETYENNFISIDNCFDKMDSYKRYEIDITLKDFLKHYMKKYFLFRIELKIMINNNYYRIKYSPYDLLFTFLHIFNVEYIQYRVNIYREHLVEVSLGNHNENYIPIIEKIIINALFKINIFNESITFENSFVQEFKNKYIKKINLS